MGSEVDPAFFQDPEHRPKPAIDEAGGIPLIDLSPLRSVDPDAPHAPQALAGLLGELEAACRDWGFFQVVNHGVPPRLLQRLQGEARAFFALPAEEKRRVSRDAVNPLGYYDTEHTKNVRDWKEVFDFMVDDEVVIPAGAPGEPGDEQAKTWKNQWPAYFDLREAGHEYARAVEKLAFALLELIALTLGLPAKRLDGFFHGHESKSSFIRLNHYPPCPAPHLALGVGRHKDGGALTVLAQDDVGGLDVRRKSDGEWVRVRPIPDSYIINVGDIIQYRKKFQSLWVDMEELSLTVGDSERPLASFLFGPKFTRCCLYQLCPPEDVTLGLSVMRVRSLFLEDLSCEPPFSKIRYGSVKKVYIMCSEDLTIPKDFQLWMTENYAVDEVKGVEGADQS